MIPPRTLLPSAAEAASGPDLAAQCLELILSHANDTPAADVVALSVGQLRTICAVALRLRLYLIMAEIEWEMHWEDPLTDWQAGCVDTLADLGHFVLAGGLEEMFREPGETNPADRLQQPVEGRAP